MAYDAIPEGPHPRAPTSFAMMVKVLYQSSSWSYEVGKATPFSGTRLPLQELASFSTPKKGGIHIVHRRWPIMANLYSNTEKSRTYHIGKYTMWVYCKYHIIHLYNHCIYALMFGTAGSCGNKILRSTTSRLPGLPISSARSFTSPKRVAVQCPL